MIWEERNLSRSAHRLGLSQPAVSHALNRLREQFDDDLFVRGVRGVVPTRFSESIAKDILLTLQSLEELYKKTHTFKPEECEETLVLSFGEYFSSTLLNEFVTWINTKAPHVKLICRSDSELFAFEDFEKGLIHLSITGFSFGMKEGFYSKKLITDNISCCLRKSHPLANRSFSLEDYLKQKHLFVSASGQTVGIVDRQLQKVKKQRKVHLVAHNFFDAGLILAKNDYILTAPKGLCQHLAKKHRLTVRPTPFELPHFPIRMYWHERLHRDPFHQWVREKIISLANSI